MSVDRDSVSVYLISNFLPRILGWVFLKIHNGGSLDRQFLMPKGSDPAQFDV